MTCTASSGIQVPAAVLLPQVSYRFSKTSSSKTQTMEILHYTSFYLSEIPYPKTIFILASSMVYHHTPAKPLCIY
jgi:hypothetical protein